MSKKQRFMRLTAALGVAVLISSQIPMQGGVALARDGYPNSGGKFLGTSLTNEQVFTGAALGLLGASLIRSLRDKGETTTTTTTTAAGGSGTTTPVAGSKDCPAATLVGDGSKSIYEMLASASGTYSGIKGLVDDAGIAEALKGEGPFTLLAPNNTALGSVPPATVAALRADKAKLADTLQYHTLIGRYKYEELCTMAEGKTVLTLSGNVVKITHANGKTYVNGVEILPTDVSASNGYVHPIGGVIK